MTNQPDFDLQAAGQISKEFLNRNIRTFQQAVSFVRRLPYGRNTDKNDPIALFSDHCGTCSTKHALLKRLAEEHHFKKIALMVGLFKMNKENTPEISATLSKNGLAYIPEAHCYLKYDHSILDVTKANAIDFSDDLLEEIEILPNQITDYKVAYHQKYLVAWLEKNLQINLTLHDIWTIREQCIEDLGDASTLT